MKSLPIIATLLVTPALLLAEPNPAATVTGKVQSVGTRLNQQVVIKNDNRALEVCRKSAYFHELVALDAMEIRVSGETRRRKKRLCYEVSAYEILSTPTGKRPLIGKLLHDEDGYRIVTGKETHKITNLLPGMETQIDKDIIVSVSPSVALTGGQPIEILSYMPHPKQNKRSR